MYLSAFEILRTNLTTTAVYSTCYNYMCMEALYVHALSIDCIKSTVSQQSPYRVLSATYNN